MSLQIYPHVVRIDNQVDDVAGVSRQRSHCRLWNEVLQLLEGNKTQSVNLLGGGVKEPSPGFSQGHISFSYFS